MKNIATLLLLLVITSSVCAQQNDPLDKLANDFWTWRAKYAPFNGDDVPRIERPGGMRDWSRPAIEKRRKDLDGFESRWKKIDAKGWPVPKQVDYRLIGSALSRVRWELDINLSWKRDPTFYIGQTLTALAEALTVPAPYDEARSREILTRIQNIPSILEQGTANLEKPPAPFASVTIQALDGVRDRLHKMAPALRPSTTLSESELNGAVDRAGDALEKFRFALQQKLPALPQQTALGREAYVWFLRNVALMPFTPEELLAMGRQEWARAVAFEVYEKNRNKDVPPLKIADNTDRWIAEAATREQEIRRFLENRGILTVPDWVQHWTLRATPEYLRDLGFSETDDFTSPSRLKENCIRYVPEPSDKLGYFWRATAMDPRPICVHEGIPGHYFQLCLSWKHEDPIRRYYYDSGPNEGLGFYSEEMMLQAGLFDDSPHSREIIYNFMRLRALRVEVDVKLALGQFTLEQAAKYLQEKVPMDEGTARQEATSFATGPGQAIDYQVGKLQIIKFLAEARIKQGEQFNLRAFHDFVWKNGNVPISLLRWEYLGDASDVPAPSKQLSEPPLGSSSTSEQAFWGWDAETWTAIGTVGATVVALAIAIVGAFWNIIRNWMRRPRLAPLLGQLFIHSELITVGNGSVWQLRLPVRNDGWLGAATNVEIFLSSIEKESGDYPFDMPTYLPIRLHWSHVGGAVCDRIPSGVHRLLDFGKIRPAASVLTFDTEIPRVDEDLRLPPGVYMLGMVIAADNATNNCQLRVQVQGDLAARELAECLSIEFA